MSHIRAGATRCQTAMPAEKSVVTISDDASDRHPYLDAAVG